MSRSKSFEFLVILCFCWLEDAGLTGVPLNYSIPGHVFTTTAHAAAHKVHIFQRKLTFPPEYMDLKAQKFNPTSDIR